MDNITVLDNKNVTCTENEIDNIWLSVMHDQVAKPLESVNWFNSHVFGVNTKVVFIKLSSICTAYLIHPRYTEVKGRIWESI